MSTRYCKMNISKLLNETAPPLTKNTPQGGPGFVPKSQHPGTGYKERPGKRYRWNPKDIQELVRLRRGGLKWDEIIEKFPGSTLAACRKRYYKSMSTTK
jgi:hypothetical protein